MKFHFTLILLFLGFFANAKYTNATVHYTNGESETGLINSFLENDLFDFNFFGTFEEGLIYNDKSIKFKLNEEAESKRIAIGDIDKIILHYGTFDKEYKALFIRNVNRKGVLEDNNVRIFLPLLRKGKINLYGFYHRETNRHYDGQRTTTSLTVTEMFYIQNENENYAIDYYNVEVQDVFNIRDRFANPLKELFKDCPELVAKVHNLFYEENLNLSKEEKKKLKEQSKMTWKALQKEYKKIPYKQKRGDLLLFHQYNMKTFDDLFLEYENCK